MNNFSSYEKIPNNFKKLKLSETDFTKLDKVDWVVTEKIHGANFSFIYENGLLRFAKRKEYLTWDDDFFAFQTLVNKIEDKVLRIFEQLSLDLEAAKYIIYGELLGGEYPHTEVENNPDLQAIQTGVYYSPAIEFCAFDIAFEEEESKSYLDYETAIAYFENENLLYAQPLFIGKLNEAFEFDTHIDSKIPAIFSLPSLENNLIEGIVIKPFHEIPDLEDRPILKIKNPEFEEENKFHEAEKWSHIPNLQSKSVELSFLLEELRKYVNKKRLESAISKIGSLDFTNQVRVLAIQVEFLNDVFTDFNENHFNILAELSEEQHHWLKERIQIDIQKCMLIPSKS